MNYKVDVLPEIRSRIAGWRLSRVVVLEVYNRFYQDLVTNHANLLKDRIIPLDVWSYRYSLPAADVHGLPQIIHFFFAVQRYDDQRLLKIVGARATIEDRREN